jgi:NitT/TauT family transport system substrate-binding protein
VLFTSRSFAREHPEAVRAFVACTARGWVDFLHGDATEALAKIKADNPQSQALMDYSMAMMRQYKLVEGDPAKGEAAGVMTPARVTALVQTLVDQKILDATPKLDDFVSFDFLPSAPKAAKT